MLEISQFHSSNDVELSIAGENQNEQLSQGYSQRPKSNPFANDKHAPKQDSRSECKVKLFAVVVIFFCTIEICIGIITQSLVLITESIHMSSDVVSLCISLFALQWSSLPPSQHYHFGWQRAEIVGAFLNLSLLYAMCAFMVLESTERLFDPQPIKDPAFIVIVGLIGFFMNLIGATVFHSHSSHGHSHSPNPSQTSKHPIRIHSRVDAESNIDLFTESDSKSVGSNSEPNILVHESVNLIHSHPQQPKISSSHVEPSSCPHSGYNANLHAIFLHILSDLLGSIVVIISGIIQYCDFPQQFKLIFDPLASFFVVILVAITSLPLLRDVIFILMHGAPLSLSMDDILFDLESLPHVAKVEKIQIWSLNSQEVVCSLQVTFTSGTFLQESMRPLDYNRAVRSIQSTLANYKITNSTVQATFQE